MSAETDRMQNACHVIGAGKLGGSLGPGSICSEIERAVGVAAPGAHYNVEIKIISSSRLNATLVVEGQTLPTQNFAVMDGNLTEMMVQRFAKSLASVVAEAAKR